MQRLFTRLSEKDKRSYAAIESTKLGRGGIDYVSELFGMDPKTVRGGQSELDAPNDPVPTGAEKKGRTERHKRAK